MAKIPNKIPGNFGLIDVKRKKAPVSVPLSAVGGGGAGGTSAIARARGRETERTNTKQKGQKYPSREGGGTHIEQKEKTPARDRL